MSTVVTYSRVSTKSQSDRGQSLEDQERRFQAFLGQGHVRIRAYAEARSAGTVLQRKTFQRAIEELSETKPDAFVVDSLDRFTRDKFLGVEQFGKIRDAGVKLWELEYSTEEPLDLSKPADRDYVWQKFSDAEAERRRISTRQRKRYKQVREQGLTTTTKPPFGVYRNPMTKRLEPHPDEAPLVREADQMLLAGRSLRDVLRWLGSRHSNAWKSPGGIRRALMAHTYVEAGVRSVETQRALLSLLAENATRFGLLRKHEYEFTGVFLCGICFEYGRRRRMHGHTATDKTEAVACDQRDGDIPTHTFFIRAKKLRPVWLDALASLRAAPQLFEAWAAEEGQAVERKRERRLAELDQREAEIKARRDSAFTLLSSPNPALKRQAELYLESIHKDDQELHVQRQAAYADMVMAPRKRDPEMIRAALESLCAIYEHPAVTKSERNRLNRELVALVGYPVLHKLHRSRFEIRWPQQQALHALRIGKRSKETQLA